MSLKQRSPKSIVNTVGIGLKSGRTVEIRTRPAPVNTSIVVTRGDLNALVGMAAAAQYVVDTRFASVLCKEGVRVSTVEHLMSACAGLGIDNLQVELTAEEVPIM